MGMGMGMGVGLPEPKLGRIIALVPAKKQESFRLSDQVFDAMQWLAELRGMSRAEVVELCVIHTAATVANGQPVYFDLPPRPRGRHKRPRRAA